MPNFEDYQSVLSKYLKKKLSLDTITSARRGLYYIELENSLKIAFSYPFQKRAKLFHSRQHILNIRDKSTNLDSYEYYPGVIINYWAISNNNGPDLDHWVFMPMADVLKAIRNYEPITGSEKYLSNNYDWYGSIRATKFFWMGDKNSESNYIPISIDNFEIIKKGTIIITPTTDDSRVHDKNLQFEIEEPWQALQAAQLHIEHDFLKRFIASLLTKPFVIFTGLSGSGKTKLAQAFARWICAEEKQYKIIPVGADWTNREPLLGFPNALEIGKYVKPDNGVIDLLLEASRTENDNRPYFLILDEMNLSHSRTLLCRFS
jgi:5-methylcytosine-specific restriction protein B